MRENSSDYHSYLLRLWRVRDDGENWRASLEDVQSGNLHGFQNLAALQHFLEDLAVVEGSDQVIIESQPDQDGNSKKEVIS